MIEATHTWKEIISQPEVWEATLGYFADRQGELEDYLGKADFDRVLAVGCGSTHYLAQSAATMIQRRVAFPARALPSSELWLSPAMVAQKGTLLLAISRSGTTSETLRAVAAFKKQTDGPVVAVTCHPESDLAREADLALVAAEAQERSVAQTRSFASMLILTQAFAAVMARDGEILSRLRKLPELLRDLVGRIGDLPRKLGEDEGIERLYFLGGGSLYGLASEVMLKFKEMSLSYSEAYHPLEFRHGPMSMVNERTLVVGLLSDTALTQELLVLEDMQRLGARVLALIDDASAFAEWRPDYVVELRSGLSEWERGALYMPVLQRMAHHRAVARGLDPDHPTHLTAVVKL